MSKNPWNTFLKMNKNNGYKMNELSQMYKYKQSGGRYRCHKNGWRAINIFNIKALLTNYIVAFDFLQLAPNVVKCTDGIIINFYYNEKYTDKSNNTREIVNDELKKKLMDQSEYCHLTIPCNKHWFEPYGPFKVHFTIKKLIDRNGGKYHEAYYYKYDPIANKLTYENIAYTKQKGGARGNTQGNKRPAPTNRDDQLENKRQRNPTSQPEPEPKPPKLITSLAKIMGYIFTDMIDTDTYQKQYNAIFIRYLLETNKHLKTYLTNEGLYAIATNSGDNNNTIINLYNNKLKTLVYVIKLIWYNTDGILDVDITYKNTEYKFKYYYDIRHGHNGQEILHRLRFIGEIPERDIPDDIDNLVRRFIEVIISHLFEMKYNIDI